MGSICTSVSSLIAISFFGEEKVLYYEEFNFKYYLSYTIN